MTQEVVLIAAMASNRVIGADGRLPWRLPDDLARFKRLTLGHTLVMGRKTYESIGRPLPGRRTIVVTRDPSWSAGADDVPVASSPEMALAAAGDGTVFIAGGGEIYTATIADADRLEITHVDTVVDGDAWFPPIDPAVWQPAASEPGDGCTWVTYLPLR